MRTTHEQTAGAWSPDGPAGPVSRPGCEMTAAEPTAAPDGGGADVLPLPELLRTGSPLDWRAVLARLAPVRRRWDLAILATLDRDIGFPADLLEVINGQAGNGRQLSPQVLSGRLRRLQEAGYVGYAEISRIPRRRRYWLLPRGRRLLDALTMLDAWYEAQRQPGRDRADGTTRADK
jgi:DNA-binding HxlR family transcriptional regulator